MWHTDRQRAESFGADAERYDRSRPTYPDAVVDAILGPAPEGLAVLDVGCGTGIAARRLASRGAQVLGVEVDPRMAALARRRGTPVEVGTFEAWDPAGRVFDRVTAAQAWHWVDPVVGAAKAAEVLRPGGRLCAFWNVGRHPAEVAAALEEAYQRAAPNIGQHSVLRGSPRQGDPDPASAYDTEADGIRSCSLLAAPTLERFAWTRTYTRDEWLDQLPTHSDHAAMPPADLQRLMAEVGAVIDGLGGSFEMSYSTLLLSATRL